MTPLFTEGAGGSRGNPAERAQQPTVSERAVREQVQRVRLDLLARETERLDRRLAQILEQQHEDRQLRDRLQSEVGSLCQRVDQLIAGVETGAGGEKSGADLRTTVKPLLQAVLDMLDQPAQKAPAGSPAARPPQAPPPPTRPAAPPRPGGVSRTAGAAERSPSAGSLPPSTPSQHVGRQPGRPAGTVAARQQPPAAGPSSSQPPTDTTSGSSQRSLGEVEARAVALQRALARLEQASQASTPAPPARGQTDPASPSARPTARPDPVAAPPEQPSRIAAGPPPRGEATAADGRSGRPKVTASPDLPPVTETPLPKVQPLDDMDDSMSAEDPAIEIARLLRPMDAKSRKPLPDQVPDRPAEPAATPSAPAAAPAPQRPAEPELLLGTSETPKVGERVGRQPPPAAKVGASEGSGVRQRLMRSAVARRTTGAIAHDRAAPKQPGHRSDGPESAADPRAGPTGRNPEPPSPPTFAEPEPQPEPLPRCLTEPWDDLDADLGKLRDGQDRGGRRWPFRRARPGGHAAGRNDDEGSD